MLNISIILVDDNAVVRQVLRSLLERERSYTVVGEAADGPAAIALVAQLRPDVLVLDIMLPEMRGLDVIRQVCQHTSPPRVVVLSMHDDAAYVRAALRAGALGYVLKEAPISELTLAVREAVHSRRYISLVLVDILLDSHFQQAATSVDDPYKLLTASERAVLPLAAQGATLAAIAERLALSPRTIETCRTNLLHTLDLRNQRELVRYALKRGLISRE